MAAVSTTEQPGPYRRLLRAVYPYRRKMMVAALFMAVVAACNGLTTWLIKPVIDKIFDQKDQQWLMLLSFAYPLLFLIKGFFDFAQSYIMGAVGQDVVRDLRIQLFSHLMALDQRFFHQSKTGELVSRVSSDVTQVQIASSRALTGFAQHVLSILALSVVVFKLDWQMAIMALFVFPLAVIPLAKFGKKIRHYSRKGQENVGSLSARIVDAVKGVRVIQVFQMEKAEISYFAADTDQLYESQVGRIRLQAMSSPVMEFIGTFGLGLTIFFGGRRVIAGDISTGTFFSFIASLMLLYDPIKKLNGLNAAVNRGAAAAERIFALLDIAPSIEDRSVAECPILKNSIRYNNVDFSYVDGQPVLQGVNFEVPRGHTVALVGPSGAGKSTLADFLPRFLDPKSGGIMWDEVDCRSYSILSIRRQIAMVDQQTVLFNASLRDNLRYAVADAGDDAIRAALEGADLLQFVDHLPKGLDTVVGENGVQMSGGQRQRLAIARAMLKDSPVLILDEATSSLDTASEQMVQAALERLMEGRTTLLIAHRLSTVRNADCIIVVNQGKVVEIGTFAGLMDAGGLFADLVERQSLAAAE